MLAGLGLFLLATNAALLAFQPYSLHIPVYLGITTVQQAGLALLFWKLRKAPYEAGAFRRAAATVFLFAVLLRAVQFCAAPSLSDDVFRFLWDGRVQAAGINPYLYPPDDPALAGLRD